MQMSRKTGSSLDRASQPLVFICHDHRDAHLAESFSNLLTEASGGLLNSFFSADRKGSAGIEFGAEWFSEIVSKINDAADVVALLTPRSVVGPWIPFEAGVAKGMGKPVFGVFVGLDPDQAALGPFSQFQNSSDGESSLTKVVLQLIKHNSSAEPHSEAVRRMVNAFRNSRKPLQDIDKGCARSLNIGGKWKYRCSRIGSEAGSWGSTATIFQESTPAGSHWKLYGQRRWETATNDGRTLAKILSPTIAWETSWGTVTPELAVRFAYSITTAQRTVSGYATGSIEASRGKPIRIVGTFFQLSPNEPTHGFMSFNEWLAATTQLGKVRRFSIQGIWGCQSKN